MSSPSGKLKNRCNFFTVKWEFGKMGRSHHQNPAQRPNGKPQTAHATQPERLCSHVTPLSLHVLFGENIGQVWHCGFPSEHCGFRSETSCTSLSTSYKNETSVEEAPRSLVSSSGSQKSQEAGLAERGCQAHTFLFFNVFPFGQKFLGDLFI